MKITFPTPKDEGEILRKSVDVTRIIVNLADSSFEVQTLHNDNRVFPLGSVSPATSAKYQELLASLAVDLASAYYNE